MKSLLLLLLIFLVGCSEKSFYEKTISKPSNSSFEAIVHHTHCFYGDLELSMCTYLAVSPDKKLALIQESKSGRLYVFNSSIQKKIWLTESFIGIVDTIEWRGNKEVFVKTDTMEKSFIDW